MGNSLRCCLACVLPCGALDLIRIVHLNGNVDEITGPVTAGEILKANPNHVLSKPSSQGVVRKIVILSPDTELKRGGIYFLIPNSSLPADKKKSGSGHRLSKKTKKPLAASGVGSEVAVSSVDCDRLVSNIVVSHKKSSRRDRKSGRVEAWRPHLSSISEDL